MIVKHEHSGSEAKSDYIIKGGVLVMEVVGVSDRSFDDAILRGLHKAAEVADGITGIEILRQTVRVDNDRITQFHVDMKVAYGAKSSWESRSQS